MILEEPKDQHGHDDRRLHHPMARIPSAEYVPWR